MMSLKTIENVSSMGKHLLQSRLDQGSILFDKLIDSLENLHFSIPSPCARLALLPQFPPLIAFLLSALSSGNKLSPKYKCCERSVHNEKLCRRRRHERAWRANIYRKKPLKDSIGCFLIHAIKSGCVLN